jgi:hypothetical protein
MSTLNQSKQRVVSSSIRDVFGHFQNLNLLTLMRDLQWEQVAWQAWKRGTQLCPVAHGLATGEQVRAVVYLGEMVHQGRGCDYAAQCLGAHPLAVLRFVRSWDERDFSPEWLLQQLQAIWEERLADAEAVEGLLRTPERGTIRPMPSPIGSGAFV